MTHVDNETCLCKPIIKQLCLCVLIGDEKCNVCKGTKYLDVYDETLPKIIIHQGVKATLPYFSMEHTENTLMLCANTEGLKTLEWMIHHALSKKSELRNKYGEVHYYLKSKKGPQEISIVIKNLEAFTVKDEG